ncbi:MAG TPA: 3'-5' exonuclease, partial [Candidatus Obscuribacterales bacterium]
FEAPDGSKLTGNFVIYDETDSLNVMKSQIAKLNLDDKVFVPREMRYAISSLKNDGYTAHLFSEEARTYRDTRLAEIFNAYQAELARNNALDFDDLILTLIQLCKQKPDVLNRQRYRFRHVLVDEFQDTNKAQYELVRLFAEPNGSDPDHWEGRSLMVVGDVDQSIYSWRKADYKIILGFQSDFKGAHLIKLEENYRSTSTILDVANSIIVNNTERIEKVLRCNRGKGGKVQCFEAQDEIDEAYYVVEEIKRLQARGRQLADCVILYRTNAQSRAVEEVLVRHHIPYTVVGSTRFYERQEIKDVLAYLKLVYNSRDGQSFARVVNVPRRGLGKTSLDRLNAYAENEGLSPLEAAREALAIKDLPAKAASTLKDFANMVDRWHMLSGRIGVADLLETILKETRYIEKLEEDANSDRDELALGRIENVRELIAVAREFESVADEPDLDSFLTRISLVSDLDAIKEDQDAVTLMTLHSAKGLEFPVVFLVGLEEGLFPHIRSLDSPSQLEEERRLMYVGVTRAMDSLYMTLARKRMLMGRGPTGASGFSSAYTIPSRFLKEVAPGLLAGFYPRHSEDDFVHEQTLPAPFEPRGRMTSQPVGQADHPGHPSNQPVKPRAMRIGSPSAGPLPSASTPNATPVPFDKLNVGDKVQHAKFGIGTVVQVIGEKEKELYNVEFDEAGKRLMDPRFAKLIKI